MIGTDPRARIERPSIVNGKVVIDPSGGKVAGVAPRLVTIADPAVLQLIGLSGRDAAALGRSSGAIALRVNSDSPGKTTAKRPLTTQIDVGANPVRTITAAVVARSTRAPSATATGSSSRRPRPGSSV